MNAAKIGSRKLIITLTLGVILLELYDLIQETQGDFGNGILFYIDEHLQPYPLIFYPLLYVMTFLLGRSAGKKILIDGKSYLTIALQYSFLSVTLITLYSLVWSLIEPMEFSILSFITISVSIFLVWILAGYAIHKSSIK